MAERARILIVDDEPFNVDYLEQELEELDYDTISAGNGREALAKVAAQAPDLILLDIMMPEMDGYEVCDRLKADEGTRDIPIIFISALGETEDKVRAFTAGCVDYVTKPFQPEEVSARVKTHLALRDLQKRLQAANRELARRLQELEARNAELDAFAHTVAHDLKNPLTTLVGFSTLLEKHYTRMSSEKLQDSLVRIAQNGRKMTNIIDELLLLATVRKMEQVATGPLDMASIVVEAQGRLAGMIEECQAEMVLPASWPVAVGYAPWVEEVWVNYVSNALKYGGQPPRVELGFDEPVNQRISASTPTRRLAGPVIRFWVRDNGPGLTPEEQVRLFAPFERLEQVRAKGHGLGLSIVRRIVEKLDGQVGVESEVGRGSVFWFTLPAAG